MEASDGVVSIGEAAHIHAASQGGPRFDPTMTAAQRRSFDNGIWLCSPCHTKIDRDAMSYPALTLRKLRSTAEAKAAAELGKRQPIEEDATNLLAAVLTRSPQHLRHSAISNVVGVIEQQLHSLDPRFLVETRFSDRRVQHIITALEPVQASLKIDTSSPSIRDGLGTLFDHGREVSIPSTHIQLNGSPLLEHIAQTSAEEGGKITFTPAKHASIVKLSLVNTTTKEMLALDDIHGEVGSGRKSLHFEGTSCGELLVFKFEKLWENVAAAQGSFSIETTPWEKQEVSSLPYLEKISKIFDRLGQSWHLKFSMEVNGREILNGHVDERAGLKGYAKSVHALLGYTKLAATLSRHVGTPIRFSKGTSFTKDEHLALADAVAIFEGRSIYRQENLRSNVLCDIVSSEHAQEILSQPHPIEELVIEDTRNEPLRVFDQVIQLPTRELVVKHAFARTDGPVQTGRSVLVELIPGPGFRAGYRFRSEEKV